MKMPWTEKSGLEKAVAIFATITVVSLGLCGVNFALFFTVGARSGLDNPFFVTGYLELFGIIIGIGGLIVVAILALFKSIFSSRKKHETIKLFSNDSEEQ